ncbi:MAG: ferrous iron transport protein A [Lachnospiraceae bacterium]|nr:ferrous iron transport protein A [Lachnospiraceae bacterium]
MTLYEGKIGTSYEVSEVFVEENITRRLEALGLNAKTVVTILNRKRKGAMIIKVRGTRLAIGKHIAKSIEVKGEKL